MTNEQMRELVKECGLDWHRGFMPLFDGDPTNRYAVLIEAAVAIERERWAAEAQKMAADTLGLVAAPQTKWPKERAVGRAEDMGEGNLRVLLDSDNDACVAVWDGKRSASVEFCNPGGGGGGRSPRTRIALIALMVAIEADNAERPDLQHPAR